MKTRFLVLALILAIIPGCIKADKDLNAVKMAEQIQSLNAALLQANTKIGTLETEITAFKTTVAGDVAAIKSSVAGDVAAVKGDVTGIKSSVGDVSGLKITTAENAKKIDTLTNQLGQMDLRVSSAVDQTSKTDAKVGDLKNSVAQIGNQYSNTGGIWVYATVVSMLIVVAATVVALVVVWLKFRSAKKSSVFFEDTAASMATAIQDSNGDKKALKAAVKKAVGPNRDKFDSWLKTRGLYAKSD